MTGPVNKMSEKKRKFQDQPYTFLYEYYVEINLTVISFYVQVICVKSLSVTWDRLLVLSSTNKTDCHNIIQILLKAAFNTIKPFYSHAEKTCMTALMSLRVEVWAYSLILACQLLLKCQYQARKVSSDICVC